ncbi:MAG: hypothetical protein IKJ76_03105 [Fibrobacter sp.]|nr:hypothetical protein [Fibrobacter sp.]
MKNINLDTFLQITILENSTIQNNAAGYSFEQLVCGDKTYAYRKLVEDYIKAPNTVKDENSKKFTKAAFRKENPELAQKIELLCEHLKTLEEICNKNVDLFTLNNYVKASNHSAKKSYILLYNILQQFLTWPNKPVLENVDEIKECLVYFANRVKQDMDSYTRYSLMHACNPQKYATTEDVEVYQRKFSRTFSL